MAEIARSQPASDAFLARWPQSNVRGVFLPPPRNKFVLRAREAAALEGWNSTELPDPPQKLLSSSQAGGITMYWLGPTEWLLVGENLKSADLLQLFQPAGRNRLVAVVDVSDQLVEIGIEGSPARDVLKSFVPLDIDEICFPAGSVSRTVFGKSEAIITLFARPDRFRIFVQRSLVEYFLGLVCQSSLEFDLGLAPRPE